MDDRQHFVEAFKAYWSGPSVDALAELLTEDVILRQPLGATTRGLEAGKRAFSRILAAIPDLRAKVVRWGPTEDGVLIEFRLHGTVGGKPVDWPAVDRFVLRDGMASERVSYFDPSRLMRAVATRPTSWPRFLRSQSGR